MKLNLYQQLERIPLLKITSVYILSLMLAPAFEFSSVVFQYLPALLWGTVVIVSCCFWFRGSRYKTCYTIGYYLLILLFGIWQFWRQDPRFVSGHFSHFKLESYVLDIIEEPQKKNDISRFSAVVKGGYVDGNFIAVHGRIMVSLKSGTEHIPRFGDRIWLRGRATALKPPFNPMEFNYKEYLGREHIYHQIFIPSSQYTIIKRYSGKFYDLMGMAMQSRHYFLTKLGKYLQNEEYFAIAAAILYGYRSDISAENLRAFTNTGTIHVLSVSGMHVAILFGFLSLIFQRLVYHPKLIRFSHAPVFVLIWAYAFIAGLDPPIARAAIMVSFVLCAQHADRKSSILNSLVAAAFFILLITPRALGDVGFQLSFLAVLGMVLFVPIFERLFPAKNRLLRFLRDTVAIAMAAQVLTTPLALYYFGQFPTYFLFANLCVDLPSTLVMYLGFIMTVSPIGWLNQILGICLEHLIGLMLYCLKFIDHLAVSTIKATIVDVGVLLLSYLAILTFLYAYRWGDKKFGYLGFFCLIGILLIDIQQQIINNRTERFRVYNTKNELTIGYFKHGQGIIYSTFDSLHQPALQYACGREIQMLANENNIDFIPLPHEERYRNYLLELPIGKIAIVEHNQERLPRADLAIVRRNAIQHLPNIVRQLSPKLIILDASNSLKKSLEGKAILDSLRVKSYIMKDNFAYVWDKENL